MPNPVFRYPVDLTGTNPNNLISGELHNLPALQNRAVIPSYAPYYTESIVVRDVVTNNILVRGTQYQCLQLVEEATIKTGKELCEVILITDETVSNQVAITYQTIGGLYQRTSDAILAMYNAVMNDNRPIDWSHVLNKPSLFPPSLHNHLFQDLVGFEPMITELERVRNAIILSDVPAFEALIDWFSGRVPNEVIMIKPTKFNMPRGANVRVNLESVNLQPPFTYYWTLEHITSTPNDFVELNGAIDLKTGFNSFMIHTRLPDTDIETSGEFRIRIRRDGIHGTILFTSGVVTLHPLDYIDMLMTQGSLFTPGVIVNAETFFVADFLNG